MTIWMSFQKYLRYLGALTVSGVASVLTACQTLDTRILDPVNVIDEEAFARTGSMIIRPPTMASRRTQGGVEFDYERYRGQSEQRVALDHYLEFAAGTINGPQTVDNSADSESGRIAYNHLIKLGPHFELEPSLGFTYERVLLTVQSRLPNTPPQIVDDKAFGMGLSFVPRFRVNRFIAIEGKLAGVIDEDSDTSFTRHIAVELSPIPQLALRGGYFWRDQDIESPEGFSDFDVNFEGPLASVTLRF
jgi:hypothetical protein